MKKYDWNPVKENVFPELNELVEITYRVKCPYGYWDIMPAYYIGDGIFVLCPGGKRVRRAVSGWRYMRPKKPYIPDDWDYSKDLENWREF